MGYIQCGPANPSTCSLYAAARAALDAFGRFLLAASHTTPRRPPWLNRFFELSLHGISGVPHAPHRFGQPLFRDTEFVGPVLNFVRLKKADAASVLRTFVHEIIGHSVSPI